MSMKNVDEKCVNLRLCTLCSLSGRLSRPEARRMWADDEVNDMKQNGGAMVKFKLSAKPQFCDSTCAYRLIGVMSRICREL